MHAIETLIREKEISFDDFSVPQRGGCSEKRGEVLELPRASTRVRGPVLALGTRRRTLRQVIPLQKRQILRRSIASTLQVFRETGILAFFGIFLLVELSRELSIQVLPGALVLASCYFLLLWAIFLVRFAYEILNFLTYSYDMDQRTVTIRKGVIVRREAILPLSRITDVYVDQDYLGVIFGLYDVHVSTPTIDSGRFAHLDGINRRGAIKLRQILLKRIGYPFTSIHY